MTVQSRAWPSGGPSQAHGPSTFGDLLERAAADRPAEVALIDAEHRWTWLELRQAVADLAAGLVAAGMRPDDRLAIQAPTTAEFVAVYLAALQAGLVIVPVNPGYTLAELDHILTDSGARMLVTSSVAAVAAADQLYQGHPQLSQIVIAARSGAEDLPTVTELLASGRAAPDGPPRDLDRTGEQLAVLLYTSGTSGLPKGAMLPTRALLANLAQVADLQPAPISAQDRIYLPLPLFHVFGLNAGLGLALYFGASVVLAPKFDAVASLEELREERATVVIGAPVEFAMWAEQPNLADGFAGVRFALSGSAPLSAALVARYAAVGVPLFEGYGLTEAAPVISLNLTPAGPDNWAEPKAGSVGRPLPGVEVRLVDSDGEAVEVGDLGMLEVRGPNLFLGYWPDATEGPGSDGWFSTGDLAVADDDGDYYLVGRRSDLVLVNGFNVYPAEVEAVFSKLPGVAEVAILGVSEGEMSEAIVAYVVPEPGAVLDPDELLEQAARSLARFKLPKQIIEVAELPHTATGKVMKWRLRAVTDQPAGRL
ncbi:MAG TPA: AMP-binding protein [Jatrophihabitans sp.]|uniref:class I adenylate-forming enzyme family protein n=1 Tax=Jatrophihabitans sp. TaxID=1932789 RepID=UPI002F05B65F